MVRSFTLAAVAAFAVLAMTPTEAGAVACAAGVYRAGCVGPNGAAAVRRPAPAPVYRRPATVACGAGSYRAGCVRR